MGKGSFLLALNKSTTLLRCQLKRLLKLRKKSPDLCKTPEEQPRLCQKLKWNQPFNKRFDSVHSRIKSSRGSPCLLIAIHSAVLTQFRIYCTQNPDPRLRGLCTEHAAVMREGSGRHYSRLEHPLQLVFPPSLHPLGVQVQTHLTGPLLPTA